MGNHYIRRFDLSKYTIKSFDDSNEICCDKNNSDILTYNANGTTKVVLDNNTTGQVLQVPLNIGGAAGAANTVQVTSKVVTGIADATGTAVFTVTVPNSAQAAMIELNILASLGAGGAIGAFEASAEAIGAVIVARTAGVNAVATAATLTNTATAAVAGATTITLAYAVSAISGAVGAVNTFTINVTITKGGGASANHQAFVEATVLNAVGSGVTIA